MLYAYNGQAAGDDIDFDDGSEIELIGFVPEQAMWACTQAIDEHEGRVVFRYVWVPEKNLCA